MKKRNCRRLPAEKEQHELATKIRKMTDSQLCDFIDEIQNSSCSVEHFINELGYRAITGNGNGIGRATVLKVQKFARENGFMTKG